MPTGWRFAAAIGNTLPVRRPALKKPPRRLIRIKPLRRPSFTTWRLTPARRRTLSTTIQELPRSWLHGSNQFARAAAAGRNAFVSPHCRLSLLGCESIGGTVVEQLGG